ncbi:MAG: aspartate--tRNA ligase [Planctomycetes bacterium]|nr:aspartate--tRNA ligase [Planctomycetota bacterium]
MLKRTHTCGELRKTDVDKEVVLNGWVSNWRDHGGLVFIDLRDRYGLTQIVFNPEQDRELHKASRELRAEFVLSVRGKVSARPEGTVNPKLDTGEVEVYAAALDVLNKADTPPFEIEEAGSVSTDLRLKHRYLDLRRPEMQRNFQFRHKLAQTIRRHLDTQNFLEIETPFMTKSTPEGARDYLVPSRLSPGHFYALPQSPQLFKQILMMSGFDRYFQIVKCFRDEDLRAQRQPEFTQLDMEMSFVEEADVMGVIEGLFAEIFNVLMRKKIQTPFPRMAYGEAMRLYGTDAPDLRYDLTLKEITDLARTSEFRTFRDVVERGGIVRGINARGSSNFSRKQLDELTAFVGEFGAKGLAWFKVEEGGFSSPIAKFFNEEQQATIKGCMDAAAGDLLLFVADREKVVSQSLSQLRARLARMLNLIEADKYAFTWITEFPLLEYDETSDRNVSIHHPFTSPRLEDLPHMEEKPLEVRARAYDVVLNGVELGGGSIRIHDPKLQSRIFKLLNIDEATAQERFGFLLEALKYGAPPHGGIALGLDRVVAMLLGLDDIREVIAFPKTQKATCLLTDAPAGVDDEQLKELGLRRL